MKKVLTYVVVLSLLSVGAFYLTNQNQRAKYLTKLKYHPTLHNPCNDTIEYSIGSIDSNFDISRIKLKKDLRSVEDVWETSMGNNFFEYSTSSNFKVNLVYDERQSRTEQKQQIEQDLDSTQQQLQDLDKRYNDLKSEYQQVKNDYDQLVAQYDKRSKEYNQKVSKYNEQGGAPPKKYEELKKEKEELEQLRQQVETERQEVNDLSNQINKIANASNRVIEKHNQKVRTYKDKFGKTRQFNAGDYRGHEINIYRFRNTSDLKLTAAHEFGHSLGLQHTKSDPASIMYHLMGAQDLNNIKLTDADVNLLNNECGK